jgi:hypothetical protein
MHGGNYCQSNYIDLTNEAAFAHEKTVELTGLLSDTKK